MINHNGKEYQPDANGWYPIECAPKDGTVINLFYNNVVYAGLWQLATENPMDGETWPWLVLDSEITHNALDRKAPTHWQPLPKPPVTQETPDEVSK